MKFLLSFTFLFILSSFANAGIAIAIATSKSGTNTDHEYFVSYNSTSSGYKAEKDAREKFEKAYVMNKSTWTKYPSARSSGSLITGYYYIISYKGKDSQKQPYTKYALGYGTSSDEAKKDAIEELKRRDWSWYEKKGYTIEENGKF